MISSITPLICKPISVECNIIAQCTVFVVWWSDWIVWTSGNSSRAVNYFSCILIKIYIVFFVKLMQRLIQEWSFTKVEDSWFHEPIQHAFISKIWLKPSQNVSFWCRQWTLILATWTLQIKKRTCWVISCLLSKGWCLCLMQQNKRRMLASAPPWLHISLSSSRSSDAFLCGVRSFVHQFQLLFVLSGITPFICKDSL